MVNSYKSFVLGLLCALLMPGTDAIAQNTTASQARQYAAEKNYNKAIEIYAPLYEAAPDSIYQEYLNVLIAAKKYKEAEKVVERQMTLRDNPFLRVDLGNVYAAEGKDTKAREQFEMLLKMINGDDMVTQRVAKTFIDGGREDYAILTYEKAVQLMGSPYMYGSTLARLYAKTDNLDKAIDILLAGSPVQYVNVEQVKTILLEILGTDIKKLQQVQKIFVKKINEQPENAFYAELLTWIYTQKNDWDGALIQIEAIDERNKENGLRLMNLAHGAIVARQYDVAAKAYDDVIAKGPESPYFVPAGSEKLNMALAQLKANVSYKQEDVANLARQYDSFLVANPRYYSAQTAADYAMLEAQYGNDVPKAIEILKRAIAQPDTRRAMAGAFKLQMGDYYALLGKLWDASLIYSQVDKDFKQDVQGEDARFRNARLAYYRGDFDWAQRQLSVLKASTSQLIANDALYLSVLITENVEDSVLLPLQRFASADLLLFQNKDKEAEQLLDSLSSAFPKHPLNDDIIMMRAEIAQKHHDYDKALGYLKTIYEQYGKDVLGDDAVFKMADIYQNNLHDNDKAKHYYEQLIIDYPGSTFTQLARQKLSELNNGITP